MLALTDLLGENERIPASASLDEKPLPHWPHSDEATYFLQG